MFNAESILIGHSLESDLFALKVNIHTPLIWLPTGHYLCVVVMWPTHSVPLSAVFIGHTQHCSGHSDRVPPSPGLALQAGPKEPHGRPPQTYHTGQWWAAKTSLPCLLLFLWYTVEVGSLHTPYNSVFHHSDI
jgi:hypothetical protein